MGLLTIGPLPHRTGVSPRLPRSVDNDRNIQALYGRLIRSRKFQWILKSVYDKRGRSNEAQTESWHRYMCDCGVCYAGLSLLRIKIQERQVQSRPAWLPMRPIYRRRVAESGRFRHPGRQTVKILRHQYLAAESDCRKHADGTHRLTPDVRSSGDLGRLF